MNARPSGIGASPSRLSVISTIAGKELVDFVRDWRTLLAVVLVPLLLFPLIFIALPVFLQGEAAELDDADLSVRIETVGGVQPPEDLIFELTEQGMRYSVGTLQLDATQNLSDASGVGNLRTAVQSGEFECILRLRATDNNASESWDYAIISDTTLEFSREARQRTLTAVLAWEQDIINTTLEAHDLTRQEVLDPVHWDGDQTSADVASAGERAAFGFSMIVPLVVALWTATSAIQPSIDMTAGERERGTLEALLTTPVRRVDLLFGKWMAVAVIAMISVLLQITGLLIAIEFLASGFLTMPEVSVTGWLLFIASVLLFAIFTVAIELAVAIRAKSVKEAGSILAPMILLFLGPTLFSQFVNLEGIELWWFVLPIFNVCLGMREALVGIHEPLHIIAWSVSSLAYALFAVIWASRQFNREDLVESIS